MLSIVIPSHGSGIIITNGQVSRVVTSYTGDNPILEKKYFNGEIALEFLPQVKLVRLILLKISQGNLAEKIRAGAMGIPAFYTPAGVGTYVKTGGFPIKYKKGTTVVEEYTKLKEV